MGCRICYYTRCGYAYAETQKSGPSVLILSCTLLYFDNFLEMMCSFGFLVVLLASSRYMCYATWLRCWQLIHKSPSWTELKIIPIPTDTFKVCNGVIVGEKLETKTETYCSLEVYVAYCVSSL